MSDVVVFAGPSITRDEVGRVIPSARVHPPAAMGDVYRAAQQRPRAIVLIDGFFDRVPAPWHKELLWALDQGVHVFGAASMGALRAAELGSFGMVGVGRVHELFASGQLEDDDEVAVAHLGPEDGFVAVSDAMVSIRETVDRAVLEQVLGLEAADELVRTAKSLFYPDRRWAAIIGGARSRERVDDEMLRSFEGWLERGRVDVKRDDAREVLEHVADWLVECSTVGQEWSFEHTTFWERAVQEIAQEHRHATSPGMADQAQRVLDELRLEPHAYVEMFEQALVLWLAGSYAQATSLELRPDETQLALDLLRLEKGLVERGDVETWLDTQEMTEADLRAMVRELATVAWARSRARHELPPLVMDVLRRRGGYHEFLTRARAKDATLNANGLGGVGGGEVDDEAELVDWWFRVVNGAEVPDDLDRYLHDRFDARDSFLRALRRERDLRAATTP
jgi:hypothetical protein